MDRLLARIRTQMEMGSASPTNATTATRQDVFATKYVSTTEIAAKTSAMQTPARICLFVRELFPFSLPHNCSVFVDEPGGVQVAHLVCAVGAADSHEGGLA